jgi:hypothetical protein
VAARGHQRASLPLQALSQRITRMGDVGSGQVTKICNQLIVAANAMLIAEAVALAENNGVDASLLAPALAGGFADSLPLQILAPRMAARQAEPVQWKVATLLKDLDNAGQLSKQSQSATPLAALASQLMRLHAAQGHAMADLSSVINLYQDQETMLKLCANLSMLFSHLPWPQRFAAARAAGFAAVEIQFPYEHTVEQLQEWLSQHQLKLVLINAGDLMQGGAGLAGTPGKEAEFASGLQQCLHYARNWVWRRSTSCPDAWPKAQPPAGTGYPARQSATGCHRAGRTADPLHRGGHQPPTCRVF